jgi:hypothetical protein
MDQARGIPDRLDAGGAGGDGRSQRPPQAVANRNLAGREIREEGWNRERRQAAHAALIRGADGVHDGRKTADAGCDDRRRPRGGMRIGRRPSGLDDRLGGRNQREEDEAVHLALVLRGYRAFGIKAAARVFLLAGHEPGDPGRQARRPAGQRAQARPAGQEARPDQFDAASQRGHHTQACDDNLPHDFSPMADGPKHPGRQHPGRRHPGAAP